MENYDIFDEKIRPIVINCPICTYYLSLSGSVYGDYEGNVKCHNCKKFICIKLKNGVLTEPPQPIYIDNPDFKSPPIPKEILEDYNEASICLANDASKACIVMCGRALEGLTIDQKAKGRTLNHKIKYLYDSNLISKPLFDAFSKVRILRNLGAHYQPLNVIKKGEDKKILDITKHVIEHIYILPLLCK